MNDQIDNIDVLIEKKRSMRKNSIYLLPNAVTLAALFSAFLAITAAFNGFYERAAIFIFLSMLLDGMDGRVARWTNSQSSFGEQLDSLADMVSFGVAPALIMYMWQLQQFGKIGYSVAFIYCACAAMRLALFNTLIGKVDKKWFIGLPSPAAAALVAGLVWAHYSYGKLPYIEYISLIITLFAGLSMVVQIKFWSFKEFNFGKRVPLVSLVLIVCILLALSWEPALILFMFFFCYSLSGYFLYIKRKLFKKRRLMQAQVKKDDANPAKEL